MTTRDIGLIETKYVEQKCKSHLLIKDLCAYLNIFQSLTYCESTTTVSKGARTTKSMGVRKIRLCKGCGRKFTPRNQRSAEAEPIQAEVTSVVEPESPVPANPRESGLTEPEPLGL